MRLAKIFTGIGTSLSTLALGGAVWAQQSFPGLETVGKPIDGAMGFQPAGSDLARDLHWLDEMVLVIIAVITAFVVLLLLWVLIRYNSKSNPVPGTFTHNSAVEVTWTIVPIVILIVIGAFSLPVLFKQVVIPKADLNIKVTGNQWYWSYEYPDEGVSFDSFLLDGSTKVASLGEDQPMGQPQINDATAQMKLKAMGYAPDEFLLAVDHALVIPVNKTVVLQITGSDVIHAWTIPAFGVKQDAVPGRLAESWFKAEREGVYFGQCNVLCGKDHSYMPIVVKVVSQDKYDAWLAQTKAADAGTAQPVTVAANN